MGDECWIVLPLSHNTIMLSKLIIFSLLLAGYLTLARDPMDVLIEDDWEVDSEANHDTKGKVVMKTGTIAVIKTFKKLKAKNKKQCMDKCKKTKNCKVFNFWQKKKQCLLQTIGLKKDKKSKGKVTGIMPCPTTTSNPPVTVKPPVTPMKPATTMKP